MKKFLMFYITIILIVLPFNTNVFAQIHETKVKNVIDLNTFELESGQKIYLYGTSIEGFDIYEENFENQYSMEEFQNIKAGLSEPYFKGPSVEDIHENGVSFLEKLVLNKEILIERVNSNNYIVYVNGIEDSINEILLQQGYLELSDSLSGHSLDPELLLASNEAINKKMGIWSVTIFSKAKNSTSIELLSTPFILMQFFSFFFSIINLTIFLKSKRKMIKFFTMVTFYLSNYSNAQLVVMLKPDSNNFGFTLAIILNTILLFICILLFVLYLLDRLKISLHLVILKIPFFIFYIILGFGSIYYSISHSQPHVHTTSYEFPTFNIIGMDNDTPIGSYLYTNDGFREVFHSNSVSLLYFLSYTDAVYFSGTTFFGGSYGDIIPKGNLKLLSIVEMTLSYLLQLILFSLLISKLFNSLNTNDQLDNTSNNGNVKILHSRKEKFKKSNWF